jgi:hypothetical protein
MVIFIEEKDNRIYCCLNDGRIFGVIEKSTVSGRYVYGFFNKNINLISSHIRKIVENKTDQLNEENKYKNKESDIKEVLNQRQKTHGEFSEVSKTYTDFINIAARKDFFGRCEDYQRLAIDVIFQKLARILNGDINFKDHWVDICGYSELVKKELDKNKKQD